MQTQVRLVKVKRTGSLGENRFVTVRICEGGGKVHGERRSRVLPIVQVSSLQRHVVDVIERVAMRRERHMLVKHSSRTGRPFVRPFRDAQIGGVVLFVIIASSKR